MSICSDLKHVTGLQQSCLRKKFMPSRNPHPVSNHLIRHFGLMGMAIALTYALTGTVIRAADSALSAASVPSLAAPSYADLADLGTMADVIVRVEIRKTALVEPQRSGPLPMGFARLYIEARVQSVLMGQLNPAIPLRYLVNVRLDAKGKLPPLTKKSVLLIARAGAISADNAGRDLQLVAPDAQFIWDAGLESRLRGVIAELQSPDAPAPVKSVREAIYVPGTLAGEGETQLFLSTPSGAPASITVVHQPKKPTSWSVSFSEVMDVSGTPPQRDTLAWYRLACFLPPALPATSNLSDGAVNRAQAARDYRLVIDSLGPCGRTRG
jgi:hypothetical protein